MSTVVSNPCNFYHINFNPGPGNELRYQDLNHITCFEFGNAIVTGGSGVPDVRDAMDVASTQQTILDSWEAKSWKNLVILDRG